jgi:O-antigen ligase
MRDSKSISLNISAYGLILLSLCCIQPVSDFVTLYIFYLWGIITLLCFAMVVLHKGRLRVPDMSRALPVVLFFAQMLISSLWAERVRESLWKASLTYIFLWVFVVSFIQFSRMRYEYIRYLTLIFPYFVLIVNIIIYVKYGSVRSYESSMKDVVGSFSNIGPAHVLLLIPFNIYYLYFERRHKLAAILSFGVSLIVILISESRGAYLMLLLVIALTIWFYEQRLFQKMAFAFRVWVPILLLCTCFLFAYGYGRTVTPVLDRFSRSQLLSPSVYDDPERNEADFGRVVQYTEAINAIIREPLTGIGFNGIFYEIERKYGVGKISHNMISTAWAEMGMVGLVLLGIIVINSVKFANRARRLNRRSDRVRYGFASAVMVALLVGLIHGQFRPQLSNAIFYVVLGLALSLGSGKVKTRRPNVTMQKE